jgi:hypothetical protein
MKKGFEPDKDTIKSCDTAAKAMQDLLVETAKIAMPRLTWIMWILTRFYRRTVTKTSIRYEFYMIPDGKEKPCSVQKKKN